MACCGQKRAHLISSREESVVTSAPAVGTRLTVDFEYVGRTNLTMQGAISGKQYHFISPGSVLAVDRRDLTLIDQVPNLRRRS